jgi:transcriptional regulator with XRE-family HTH domain
MITAWQCIAARQLLHWTRPRLADAAKTSTNTVRNLELGIHEIRLANAFAIRRALEAAGVIFLSAEGDEPGVRLRVGKDRRQRHEL